MRAIVSITLVMIALAAGALADQPAAPSAAASALFSTPPLDHQEVALVGYDSYPPSAYMSFAAPPSDEPEISMDELRNEMKKLAWTKGEMKVVPYGSLWGSAIYNTHRTFPGAYTLYVLPLDEQGEDTFEIDTRRTRFGLDVTGPTIPAFGCAQSGGRVEVDFHGAFVVENKPGLLLRHMYGEIKDERFRLLAGQTWDVISPLNPGDLSYTVLWAQGNIGYRRAQIRVERYFEIRSDQVVTLQLSANQNIVSDFAGTTGVTPESAGWPVLEGRLAWTDNSPASLEGPVTLGVSGHIGEQGFDFTDVGPAPLLLPPQDDVRIKTWSINADLRVPITRCTGFQGEAFYGSNLSTFLGGIVQGVSLFSRRGIRSRGGWAEVWHDWSPSWHSHVGFGIDDPYDPDIVSGRSYNQVIFANVSYNMTDFIVIGTEVTVNKTTFRETRVGIDVPEGGESVGLEFTGQYNF